MRDLDFVAAQKPKKLKGYICYAPEDEKMCEQLRKHLNLEILPDIEITWDDGRISGGQVWATETRKRLDEAQIIIFGVSIDSLNPLKNSQSSIELAQCIERHNKNESRVVPVLFRCCSWESIFGPIQVLPRVGKPIREFFWPRRERVFRDVAKDIGLTIIDFVGAN